MKLCKMNASPQRRKRNNRAIECVYLQKAKTKTVKAMSNLPVDANLSTSLRLNLGLFPVDGSSNQATALFTLDAAAKADVVIPDESPDGEDPALVTG